MKPLWYSLLAVKYSIADAIFPSFLPYSVYKGLQIAEVKKRAAQILCVYSEEKDFDERTFKELKKCVGDSILGQTGPWPAKSASVRSSADFGNLYC
jgi:hypothetical protein